MNKCRNHQEFPLSEYTVDYRTPEVRAKGVIKNGKIHITEVLKWDPKESINNLPETLKQIFISEAKILKKDLDDFGLHVILMPAPDPGFDSHSIRVSVNQNPPWFSEFFQSGQRLRRDRSIRSLNKIINNRDVSNGQHIDKIKIKCNKAVTESYETIYRKLILKRLMEGYNFHGHEVPPSIRFTEYYS